MTEPRAKPINPRYQTYSDFGQVAVDIQEIYRLAQPITHRVVSSVPIVTDLKEGEVLLYESGTTRRIYTKINGSIRYAALT